MLPVAFSQYLAAMSPSEIPPPSLRELAFKSPGIDIAQAVFGILISRYRADPEKLRKLGTEEVVARISEQVSKLSERFRSDEGYDARRRLREIIDVESAPAIEKELDRVNVGSKAVIVPKAADEGPREAAKRMARELTRLKDTKVK